MFLSKPTTHFKDKANTIYREDIEKLSFRPISPCYMTHLFILSLELRLLIINENKEHLIYSAYKCTYNHGSYFWLQ